GGGGRSRQGRGQAGSSGAAAAATPSARSSPMGPHISRHKGPGRQLAYTRVSHEGDGAKHETGRYAGDATGDHAAHRGIRLRAAGATLSTVFWGVESRLLRWEAGTR